MKLNPVPSTKTYKAPSWFKIDPKSGYYWYDIYRAGRKPPRLCRSTGERESRTKAQHIAETAIAKWLGEELTQETPTVTFRDIATDVLENQRSKFARKKIRKGTLENSEFYIPELIEEFGFYSLDQITLATWDGFVAEYHRRKPGQSLKSHWGYMRLVMNYAFKNGLTKKPWKVENPDPPKKGGRVLTDEEKTAILGVASKELRDQLLFAMTMGMRLREHLYLSWDRVDFEQGVIILRAEDVKTGNQSGGKGRIIAMSPQVRAMLERRYRERKTHIVKSPFVFPSPKDPSKPIEDNKSAWKTAKRKAGIRGRCRYHDLRHTFASECAKLVQAGRSSSALVCSYIGMSLRVFERVYLHLNHDDTAIVSKLIAVTLR